MHYNIILDDIIVLNSFIILIYIYIYTIRLNHICINIYIYTYTIVVIIIYIYIWMIDRRSEVVYELGLLMITDVPIPFAKLATFLFSFVNSFLELVEYSSIISATQICL